MGFSDFLLKCHCFGGNVTVLAEIHCFARNPTKTRVILAEKPLFWSLKLVVFTVPNDSSQPMLSGKTAETPLFKTPLLVHSEITTFPTFPCLLSPLSLRNVGLAKGSRKVGKLVKTVVRNVQF